MHTTQRALSRRSVSLRQPAPSHRRASTLRPAAQAAAAQAVFFRKARPEETQNISLTIWQERMNPLGIEPDRFTVAVDSANNLLGFAQLELKEARSDKKIWELRSLVVQEPFRGRGIGTQLVKEVVREAAGGEVYLVTIGKRQKFYEQLGFQELPMHHIPGFLQFEMLAGTLVARVAANDHLVAMRATVE